MPSVDVVTFNNMEDCLKESMDIFKSSRQTLCARFEAKGLQPHVGPLPVGESDEENLAKKRANYRWLIRPNFVPQVDPNFDGFVEKDEILNPDRLPTPDKVHLVPHPSLNSMAALEDDNRTKHHDCAKGDFYDAPNIGLRTDWFTDAVFAQQQFTGVNPNTITILTDDPLLRHFASSAELQELTEMGQLIQTYYPNKQLYVQDCSYYREAAGMGPDEDIMKEEEPPQIHRYSAASVVLFSFGSDGKLHPLAITLDYKGTEASRITIFNKRLSPSDTSHDEAVDWPWRYAKMVAQVSDWNRHEIAVHLTNTHIIEEAIIIAAQRNLPDSHIILQIMNAHWITTLSLNSLAYELLVPQLLQPVSAFTHQQVVRLIGHARQNFDFTGSYVPADLEKRGFPVSELENPDGKLHNYTYARQIYKMWNTIHEYVASILNRCYANDEAVRADSYISNFIAEVRAGDGVSTDGGFLPQFPAIDTLEGLIDMVTMWIHIAAPQHTAVNYLQQFYLAFIPNRPGSLFAPLPTSLAELHSYTESKILASLPLQDSFRWMMMAQVPYLLSEEVDTSDNILSYADKAATHFNPIVAEAGKVFRANIHEIVDTFKEMSGQNDDKDTEYTVMYPQVMAAGIII